MGKTVFILAIFFPQIISASFPIDINVGSGFISNTHGTSLVYLGNTSGTTQNPNAKIDLGFFYASKATFDGFIASGPPRKVFQIPAPAPGSRYIESVTPTVQVGWSDGRNQIPVQYRVYLGRDPLDLALWGITQLREIKFENLEYLTDYYWQVETFDSFGRVAKSNVFTFALSFSIGRFYSAPNPFRAGVEPTTFIFNMKGNGSAEFLIYSTPHFKKVFNHTCVGLSSGVNTYSYFGVDDNGEKLLDGVYMVVLNKSTAQGNENERFKIMVIK